MDTRYLKSFLKIAETRSISRAAESLGITQPSLSQQVLRLEDEVGTKLFRRTARGVTLTEAGRIFLEHARHILQRADQAVEDVRQLDALASGQVIFAMPPSVNLVIGAALVEAIAEDAPHVSVRLVDAFTGTIRGWLEQGKIDLGILYDLGPLRHLSGRPLVREELLLCGPPHDASGDTGEPDVGVPLAALAGLPLIAPGPQHGLRQMLEREAAQIGVQLSVVHEIDSLSQILTLVERGHGWAVLPEPVIADMVRAGRTSCIRVQGQALSRSLTLVRNPNHVVSYASVRVEDLTFQIMHRLIEAGDWPAEAMDFAR